MKEETLNKYKLVVDEWFINGFNGTKAYQKFYPKADSNAADVGFREIYGNLRIKEYIKLKEEGATETLKTSHEALLDELVRWAYSDITETILLTPEQLKELPLDIRRLITKFKHTQRHLRDKEGNVYETVDVIELHFVSKEKAMEMIHKHTGFYGEHNSQKRKPVSKINVTFKDFS
jgi:phage terminase small subunit